MNLVERGGSQKHVVFVEVPVVMAEAAIGQVEVLMVRTAGKAPLHVIYDSIAVDKGAIVAFVA